MKENIPVFKPYLSELEYDAALKSLKEGWLGAGKYVAEFENKIAQLVDVDPDSVVAVNTGTSAVHLGLIACDVNEGDEVITPSFNNIADFQMIRLQSAEPVFCDINEDSMTIDHAAIKDLITNRTKAVICLDYGAELCLYEEVKQICDYHGISLLYDAAHSFGSRRKNVMVGRNTDVCIFSFDPVKNITSIDGGAIILKDKDKAAKFRAMRQLGQEQNQELLYQNKRSWTYDVTNIGFRYHLANLHAAIGVQQLNKITDISERRRAIFNRYLYDFQGMHHLIRLPRPITDEIVPFIFVIRILDGKRKLFREFLFDHNIDTGIHWRPGHNFSSFENCKSDLLVSTNVIADQIVSLPFFPGLTYEQVDYIVQIIKQFYKEDE